MAKRAPDRLTTEFYKEKRDGRLFLDCNRNAWAQTAVPPYSIRPKKGDHVAVPLSWDELDTVAPDAFDVHSIVGRLETTANPWKNFGPHMRSLTAAERWLAKVGA